MKSQGIISQIMTAYRFDKKHSPSWPDHPAAQAGKVNIEAGELMKAADDFKYQKGLEKVKLKAKMKKEAIEVIVKAIRCLESWEEK